MALVKNIFARKKRQAPAPSPITEALLRERFDQFRSRGSADVDACEIETGEAVPREWVDNLALHTQVVAKATDLNWLHGRVIWALFAQRLENLEAGVLPIAVDTGTARGFSALTLANVLVTKQVLGAVLTFDILPHQDAIFSNCLDGVAGPVSRELIWARWPAESEKVFVFEGDTAKVLSSIVAPRICFAFLDAHHDEPSVLAEFEWVSSRQEKGDVIVFDDVSESLYPGVWSAVQSVVADGRYSVRMLSSSPTRHYACATRI